MTMEVISHLPNVNHVREHQQPSLSPCTSARKQRILGQALHIAVARTRFGQNIYLKQEL